MIFISLGITKKNIMGKQAFPPKGNQTFWIQIFGMYWPKPHTIAMLIVLSEYEIISIQAERFRFFNKFLFHFFADYWRSR